MTVPRLAIVIHAEEEFDWSGDFKRSNTSVSHGKELTEFVETMIQHGAKVTLAMDYPFVMSSDGNKVIEHFIPMINDLIEFSAHLHPWVNPPFENENDVVDNYCSYPGNLSKDIECAKMQYLSDVINNKIGERPTTYLAGRYGVGKNSNKNLRDVGFNTDLSISSYCDFRHQQGPDFSEFTNKMFSMNNIVNVPHTCTIVSIVPFVQKYFNKHPSLYEIWQQSRWTKLLAKLLRVRRFRLSPEGFSFKHMKMMVNAQLACGQKEFILSFHSPSVKQGMTPYVSDHKQLEMFKSDTIKFIQWFQTELDGVTVLPSKIRAEFSRKNPDAR